MDSVNDFAADHNRQPAQLHFKNYEDFVDRALNIVRVAITQLEEMAKLHLAAGEDALTSILKMAFVSAPEFYVTSESFSNGRVDLTIVHPFYGYSDRYKIKGEAKQYKGPKYCDDGVSQLMSYQTRHHHGIMLIYFRGTLCDPLFKKYLERVKKRSDFIKEEADKDSNRVSSHFHNHSSGYPIHIVSYACHCPNGSNDLLDEGDAEIQ